MMERSLPTFSAPSPLSPPQFSPESSCASPRLPHFPLYVVSMVSSFPVYFSIYFSDQDWVLGVESARLADEELVGLDGG